MKKSTVKTFNIDFLYSLIKENLLKRNSIFILDDGRLVHCHYEITIQFRKKCNPVSINTTTGDIVINYPVFSKAPDDMKIFYLFYACHCKETNFSDYLSPFSKALLDCKRKKMNISRITAFYMTKLSVWNSEQANQRREHALKTLKTCSKK